MKLRDVHFLKLGKVKGKKILLLLLMTLVIFVLWKTKVQNFMSKEFYKSVTVCFTRTDFSFQTSSSPSPEPKAEPETKPVVPTSHSFTSLSNRKPPRCSFSHLSPENGEAGRRLLDSISWPETPPLPKPFSLNLTSSAAHSFFTVEARKGGWRVGQKLTVMIQMKDFRGKDKKSGGDFLSCRLHSPDLGAGVVGQIQDHRNGTFTAVFPLLWSGTVQVEVTLVQTSESISVLKRLTEEQPDRIYFVSAFRSGSVTENSFCNVCLDPERSPLCNFTDPNTGEQWFCYKPKTLSCSARVSHTFGGFTQKISKDEATLFQKDLNMKVSIRAMGNSSVTVFPKTDETKKTGPDPAGYYYGNQWRPLSGPTPRSFNNATIITACLRGKQLYLLGDSTIRQYYEYITGKVPNLLTFDKHSPPQSGPLLALDHTNDIMVTYRGHAPPIRFGYPAIAQMRYVATELDGIVGGANTVVVIGVWSHFSTFPMEVYYQRLMTIYRAVQRLLSRAPDTKVIVRTANMKALWLYESLTNSDWFSLQRDRVLRALFKDSGVLLLDAWELGQAHHLPHSLHPQPEIVKTMMDVVLSYSCPDKGG